MTLSGFNKNGQAVTEYVLISALLGLATITIIGHGSAFFKILGVVYRTLSLKLAASACAIIAVE